MPSQLLLQQVTPIAIFILSRVNIASSIPGVATGNTAHFKTTQVIGRVRILASGTSRCTQSHQTLFLLRLKGVACETTTTLPTASQTQLSPNVLQEVNQAVRALQPKENGGRRASKRKYTTSFTPEDRARIGKYASENVNAAAVKKFKATHEIQRVPYVLVRSSHTPTCRRGVACPRTPKRIY